MMPKKSKFSNQQPLYRGLHRDIALRLFKTATAKEIRKVRYALYEVECNDFDLIKKVNTAKKYLISRRVALKETLAK